MLDLTFDHALTDALFWSYSKLDDLVQEDPEAAWEIILEILPSDQSAVIHENLSAGPLEDLLARHGSAFIDRVKRPADQDEHFREAAASGYSRLNPRDF